MFFFFFFLNNSEIGKKWPGNGYGFWPQTLPRKIPGKYQQMTLLVQNSTFLAFNCIISIRMKKGKDIDAQRKLICQPKILVRCCKHCFLSLHPAPQPQPPPPPHPQPHIFNSIFFNSLEPNLACLMLKGTINYI